MIGMIREVFEYILYNFSIESDDWAVVEGENVRVHRCDGLPDETHITWVLEPREAVVLAAYLLRSAVEAGWNQWSHR